MESPDRYRSLDAIRGIAAFGVMLFHYGNHFGTAPFLSMRQLGWVYRRGSILVDVFFVMSGYLLATIYAGRSDVGRLIWRRIARLAPLHWLMLALVTLLQLPILRRHGTTFVYLNYDPYHFLLNLVLLHCSGLGSGFSFDGPAWSISVEWIVNLALFAFLWLGPKVVPRVAAGIALSAAVILWVHGQTLMGVGVYKGFLEAILLRGFVGFFVGVALTGLFPLDAPVPGDTPRERGLGYAWDAVAVINGALLHRYMAFDSVATRPGVDFVIGMVVIPAIIVGAVRGRLIPRVLGVAPLQWLGRISYSIYLVHFPVQAVFLLLFPPPDRWLDYSRPEIMAAYVTATLAVSYVTWRFVEAPAQALLQRVTLRPAREPRS